MENYCTGGGACNVDMFDTLSRSTGSPTHYLTGDEILAIDDRATIVDVLRFSTWKGSSDSDLQRSIEIGRGKFLLSSIIYRLAIVVCNQGQYKASGHTKQLNLHFLSVVVELLELKLLVRSAHSANEVDLAGVNDIARQRSCGCTLILD